jgi:RNA 3'-terminal phosphate cyclase (ATP)
MLLIDGAAGEGGGQILRTSLALSMVTGKPFRAYDIRARRSKAGLLRQHLTAVLAAADISGATVKGAELGSRELLFHPGPVRAGRYTFEVGSAGSATLVLQTVLPPLMLAGAPSQLQLGGGTHNPHAPPFEFLRDTFFPLLQQMGVGVQAILERPGFYPAGGGILHVDIASTTALQPLTLNDRGMMLAQHAVAMLSHLPRHVGERELATVRNEMQWTEEDTHLEVITHALGPGNVLQLRLRSERVTEVFTAFGQRGVPAEKVAATACEEARRYLESEAVVGEHLADQLLLPLALAGGGEFLTMRPTEHTMTNARVIGQFVDIRIDIEPVSARAWRVAMGPR